MEIAETPKTGEVVLGARPDFIGNVSRLEALPAEGIRTPEGDKRFQFRAGIEIEFALLEPATFREELEYGGHTDESMREKVAEIQNPETIKHDVRTIAPAEIEAYKAQARAIISGLPASDDLERSRQQKWLDQIDDFSIRDFINMKLYAEFSKPTLKDNKPPKGSLQELDDFSESQGWLEFRFGTSNLQEGYYDDGVSECRLAPCLPSEALRRRAIIMKRLTKIADGFGILVQSNSKTEHLNLSIYSEAADGAYQPIIGTDETRQDKTLDVLAGISVGFEDGLAMHPNNMSTRHLFDPRVGDELVIGPTRKPLRVIDDRMELGAKFEDSEQGMDWLVAGSIYGLQEGATAISERGYTVPHISETMQVNRTGEFVKSDDIQIQRAFEEALYEDGRFDISRRYNLVYGRQLTAALLGHPSERWHGALNELVFSATMLDDEGTPYIDREALAQNYHEGLDGTKRDRVLEALGSIGLLELADRADAAFKSVRLSRRPAIEGEIPFKVNNLEDAYGRMEESPVVALATGGQPEQFTAWLEAA